MGLEDDVIAIIKAKAQEGDVINLDPAHPGPIIGIGCALIRLAQRKLFGKSANWRDSHTMLYFTNESIRRYIGSDAKVKTILAKDSANELQVFSVAPPKASFISIDVFALDTVSVYRYAPRTLAPRDIELMLQATLPLLLTDYDFGQLADIGMNEILGYPFENKVRLFDFGEKKKVCATGVAIVFQKWRKELEKEGITVQRLFSKLDPEHWKGKDKLVKEFLKYGHGWSIESTYPAQFANSDYYSGEFRLVLRIEKGRVVYSDS